MAKRENFTADRVSKLQCESGKQQSIFWDGKTPGLGLRVTKAGARSYIFEAWLHGKSLRVTIGDVRTWTIGKAQAEATRLKSLTDQGIDPRQREAAPAINRAPQTLRKWACLENGPIRPIRINGRLAWKVSDLQPATARPEHA